MRRTTDAELTGEHNLGTSTQGQRNVMDKSKGAIYGEYNSVIVPSVLIEHRLVVDIQTPDHEF